MERSQPQPLGIPSTRYYDVNDAARPSTPNEPPLSEEQRALVDLILTGRNVFYTGAAGTGKSTVLRTAVDRLRRRLRHVDVVAPTGRAALAVKGITTWSYAGWTPVSHARSLDALRRWSTNEKNFKRLGRTDVLIIDEISMVENHHLERLNEIMKAARAHAQWRRGPEEVKKIRNSAFGGCQIVATGDFFQLPPVRPFDKCIECGEPLLRELQPGLRVTEYRCPRGHGNWPDSDKWAFQSDAWRHADFAHVELRQVHRQAEDPSFIGILHRFRSGTFTFDDVMVLADPYRKTRDLANAVRLYPIRTEVAKYNADKLEELKTPPHDFVAQDSFHSTESAHPKRYGERKPDGTLPALGEHKYEPFLRLKEGMPVILLSNLNIKRGLVNGSQGIIVGFDLVDKHWVLTRRKRFMAGLKENDKAPSSRICTICDDEIYQYVASAASCPANGSKIAVPVVKFDNNVVQRIYPECSTREEVAGEAASEEGNTKELASPVLCRTQIPLTAGWAMSVHKAQGMTLGKVIVDLTHAFADGQVYVALSRARSLDGLKIEGNPEGLLVGKHGNREVMDFYGGSFGDNKVEKTAQLV